LTPRQSLGPRTAWGCLLPVLRHSMARPHAHVEGNPVLLRCENRRVVRDSQERIQLSSSGRSHFFAFTFASNASSIFGLIVALKAAAISAYSLSHLFARAGGSKPASTISWNLAG